MPDTITSFIAAGAELGPGSPVLFVISGPPHQGDFVQWYLSTTGTTPPGDQILSGTQIFETAHSTSVQIDGWFNIENSYERVSRVISMAPVLEHWPADGASVYVYAVWVRGVTALCSVTATGFTYRRAAGIHNLIIGAFNTGLLGTTNDDVLAAVQRTVTYPGQRP